MKLWALSDLHLGFPANRAAWEALPERRNDWLILAGDVGETRDHLARAFSLANERYARVLWVPGNHELWTTSSETLRGQERYESMVEACRAHGVVTPEDEYPLWDGPGGRHRIALLFLLYDYSFRPPEIPLEQAVAWAQESGIRCADEDLLHPDPYPTRQDWCAARCLEAERRLAAAAREHPLVIVNHFPLRQSLVRLRRIPRFSIWCGTTRTGDWHTRFNARVVVSGHLHVRTTEWIDGVRFEEVSLGYPRQRRAGTELPEYLREILPGPPPPPYETGPEYHW